MKSIFFTGLFILLSILNLAKADQSKDQLAATEYQIGIELYQQQNYQKAFEHLQIASQLNDPKAQYALGVMFLLGQATPQDRNKALDLFKKSAEQQYVEGEYNLALLLMDNNKITDAIFWLKKAISQGSSDAEYNLGVIYYNGYGVKQDYQQAFKWYQLAASHDNPYALTALGDLYRTGTGVKKDLTQAFLLFKKSALTGYPVGISVLSSAYFYGIGTKVDLIKAYALACYAELYNEPDASFEENRQKIAAELTDQQSEMGTALFEQLKGNLNIMQDW